MRTSAALRASGPPIIQGKGAATGSVPTDEEQATGLERFELEHKLAGQDAFDMTPLQADRMGTTKEPIKVLSYFPTRIIGCSGSPAGSHDTVWLHLNRDLQHHRCSECGSVYEMDFQGDEHAEHH
ncbi:putative COX4-cytochrome-c oxidase chain IV [Tilletiopsis washingtonensis]|uniref:Putative COX4-cytochrome-c oxidase chain IV n=1 Tax=Tilletiopsis washingtonensis TaxID=58919 RepID=A0A316ZIK4_9BASI|nr:putative COX4-cytochrome-c oxidase chain IV [Tilletiopsis washingtonensis]PWO00855.1 putative COX4-cytochrome-c oxidase chain IV [Tilletiopsis washingtonensis]